MLAGKVSSDPLLLPQFATHLRQYSWHGHYITVSRPLTRLLLDHASTRTMVPGTYFYADGFVIRKHFLKEICKLYIIDIATVENQCWHLDGK